MNLRFSSISLINQAELLCVCITIRVALSPQSLTLFDSIFHANTVQLFFYENAAQECYQVQTGPQENKISLLAILYEESSRQSAYEQA